MAVGVFHRSPADWRTLHAASARAAYSSEIFWTIRKPIRKGMRRLAEDTFETRPGDRALDPAFQVAGGF
ncbi:hypothetical protein HYPDE_24793 [Hyphomicrobium denitrificans 1NES1]|uniref:Uncharacterized protein n=1 Tax=Hyphomicrobium denitrificans 1NES1 TaxID=670307 RepID=N0B138_9HYPH|nr:hypothetical protein HYPDE_24793 [Hyphomicrobium denitrificans 1NES1]